MTTTTFDDPFEDDDELFWDDLNEWETEQVFRDGWLEDAEAIEEEDTIDLYDQYEYMLEHQDDE